MHLPVGLGLLSYVGAHNPHLVPSNSQPLEGDSWHKGTSQGVLRASGPKVRVVFTTLMWHLSDLCLAEALGVG